MNPDTGHLIDLNRLNELFEEIPEIILERDYSPIPPDLQNAAQKKLAGKPEAFVSKNSGGKLSNYAKRQIFLKRTQRK